MLIVLVRLFAVVDTSCVIPSINNPRFISKSLAVVIVLPGVSSSINAFVSRIIKARLDFNLATARPISPTASFVRSDVTSAVALVNPLSAISIISSIAFSIAV